MASNRFFAIGIGSNVGDRLAHFNRALAMIDRIPGFRVLATSPIYESAPWGKTDMDPFLNAAIGGSSDCLSPTDLLKELQIIENDLGRQRDIKWGPRTLDLDLLACDDHKCESDALTLPHPWIGARPFVYIPLRHLVHLYTGWNSLIAPTDEALAIEHETVETQIGHGVWDASPSEAQSLTIETSSEEETSAFAKSIASFLLPGDAIALDAPMGAGKSVFARGVARGLGITGPVPSPSYTLCNLYEANGVRLEHWDFYRMESHEDLDSAGFFSDESRDGIRLMEWAENFRDSIGDILLSIHLDIVNADTRRIKIESPSGNLPFPIRALASPKASIAS